MDIGFTGEQYKLRAKVKLHHVLFEIIVTQMLSADPALRKAFPATLTNRIQVGPVSPDFHNGTVEAWTCDDALQTEANKFLERVNANLRHLEASAED